MISIDKISFTIGGLEDYIYWQTEDKRTLKKINQLIADIRRDPYNGLGHPEPLKYESGGCWSRKIDEKNRIIYRIKNEQVEILQCRGHYSDK